MTRRLALALAVSLLPAANIGAQSVAAEVAKQPSKQPSHDTTFAATFARLSEPSGYFDTDNLISNESSYLHVMTRLHALGVQGGAYIGVGPDQNYSYIAAIRPRLAFLIDVRRDNALQHLMYRALFARSRNRMEFLCRLLGRTPPPNVSQWDERPIADILAWIDRRDNRDNRAGDAAFAAAEQRAVVEEAGRSGIPLSQNDRATISRLHGEFIRAGTALRFTSFGRSPRAYYPTFGQLILEHDLDGHEASYLAREDDFRYVKEMHASNRIIPVVGNLGGEGAFAAIGRELASRGERLSAIYTSNVEFYIWGDSAFSRFARTLVQMPRAPNAVIIRSYFSRGDVHPLAVSGYASVQLLQPVNDFARRFAAGEWRGYRDLVTLGAR